MNKNTIAEEVCIVRYADNNWIYKTVSSSKELKEAISEFVGGSDYEVQYMGGALCKNATNNVLSLLEIAEEYAEDLETVGALYNHFTDLETIKNVLDNGFIEISERNKLNAFIEYTENTGLLEEIPEHLVFYFDFEKYMQDLVFEGLDIIEVERPNTPTNTYLFTH